MNLLLKKMKIDGSPVIRSLKLTGDPASQDVKERKL
jgi:hypothetical protein